MSWHAETGVNSDVLNKSTTMGTEASADNDMDRSVRMNFQMNQLLSVKKRFATYGSSNACSRTHPISANEGESNTLERTNRGTHTFCLRESASPELHIGTDEYGSFIVEERKSTCWVNEII